jgi:hypothetical protein
MREIYLLRRSKGTFVALAAVSLLLNAAGCNHNNGTEVNKIVAPTPLTLNALNGTTVCKVPQAVDLLAFQPQSSNLQIFWFGHVEEWSLQPLTKVSSRIIGAQRSFPPSGAPELSADQDTLLTTDRDERDRFYVKMWDVKSGKLLRALQVSDSMEYQRHAAMSPQGLLATQNSTNGDDKSLERFYRDATSNNSAVPNQKMGFGNCFGDCPF